MLLGPAVDLLEGAAVYGGGVQPAAQQGFGGLGYGGVDTGAGPYRCEERGRASGGGSGVLAALDG